MDPFGLRRTQQSPLKPEPEPTRKLTLSRFSRFVGFELDGIGRASVAGTRSRRVVRMGRCIVSMDFMEAKGCREEYETLGVRGGYVGRWACWGGRVR